MNLRAITDQVGKEVEKWSYETLSRPAEEISFSREIDGQRIGFSLEANDENELGDLFICMDCQPEKVPFFTFLLPSYVFWKRRDGSVYY